MSYAASRPLRVFLLSQEYPTECTVGGIATFNHQLANGLVRAGHHVTVVTEAASPRECVGPYEDRGVRIVPVVPRRILWRQHLGGWNLLFRSISFAAAACRVFRREHGAARFDVVEGQDAHAHLCMIQRRASVATVARLHTPAAMTWALNRIPADTGVGWMWRLERDTMLRAHALVSVSHSLAHLIAPDLGIAPREVAVVYNAVDLDTYSPQQSELSPEPTVLFAGRLEPRKGPDVLLESVPFVLARHPGARFVFAGTDAGMGARLQRRVAQLGVTGSVTFLGVVPPERMVSAYRQAWVCVLPSTVWENFSMVALEALGCGCPVVATNVGGFPEMIRDGENGVLVATCDAEATAAAINSLLADRVRRSDMAAAARRVALESFGRDRLVAETIEVYRAACEVSNG
jgi:glycogen synthase